MITADRLARVPLFANVPLSERESIAAKAADLEVQPGDFLVMEGEEPAFFVVLSGRLTVFKRVGARDQAILTLEPGGYFGEVPLLLGSKSLASVRADIPSTVMRLEALDFHELIVGCPRLNAEVLRTMADRLGRVQKLVVDTAVPVVTVVGHATDVQCHDVRDFLSRNHVPFTWHNVDEPSHEPHPYAETPSCETGPVVVLDDGTQLVVPTLRQLADRIGLNTTPARDAYDVVVVGGGPAGLAAAVYGASEGLCTLLVEGIAPGGQAGTSSRIENYLGFPSGLSGDELSALAERQAERLGAELIVARTVTAVDTSDGVAGFQVVLDRTARLGADAIVIATGVGWRHLDVPGFDALVSRGIYYGAARTEATATRGHDVYLVGGGNSAGQAALLFSGYARAVTLILRGRSLDENMSQYLIEQISRKANIQILPEAEVVEARGVDRLEEIVIAHRPEGTRETRAAGALFVFIGADAETEWLPIDVIKDERGYVCTGRDILDLERHRGDRWPLERDPYLLETSVPGIFAAGDVRHGSVKRCASAVGEGSMAIAFVHQYLAEVVRMKEHTASSKA